MARGSIRKRGTNTWQLVYDAPRGRDGERRQRYETIHGTKRQAERRLTQILDSLSRDRYVEPTKLSMAQFLERFLEDYAVLRCRPRTIEGYENIIRVHLMPEIGHIPVSQLSVLDLQRYYAGRLAIGLASMTILHHHRLIHRALAIAVSWDILNQNPADRVTPPAPDPSRARSLTLEEVHRILEASHPTPYFLPTHLALYAGLRRGEVLGLRWADIDLERNFLKVDLTLLRVRGKGHIWGPPKSKGSSRRVAISSATLSRLEHQRDLQRSGYSARGIGLEQADQVCGLPDGRLMKPDALSHAFNRIVRGCGIQARFHDLRHTHASFLLNAGTPANVVQSRLGHQSIATTVDIYGHVLADSDIVAGATFEKVIAANVGKMWADGPVAVVSPPPSELV